MTKEELEKQFKQFRFHYYRTMGILFHVMKQHPRVKNWNLYLEDVLDEKGHLKNLPEPCKLGLNVAGTDLMITFLFGDALKVVDKSDVHK